jgi:hypothetical protein
MVMNADLAQKYSVGLQEIFVSRLCSQEENSFSCPGCNQPSRKVLTFIAISHSVKVNGK